MNIFKRLKQELVDTVTFKGWKDLIKKVEEFNKMTEENAKNMDGIDVDYATPEDFADAIETGIIKNETLFNEKTGEVTGSFHTAANAKNKSEITFQNLAILQEIPDDHITYASEEKPPQP